MSHPQPTEPNKKRRAALQAEEEAKAEEAARAEKAAQAEDGIRDHA